MLISLVLATVLNARAESKTCEIKGMVCQGCVDMVTKSLCSKDYEHCSVRLKSKREKIGEVTLVTKDPAAKIDFEHARRELDKMTYALSTCVEGEPKARR